MTDPKLVEEAVTEYLRNPDGDEAYSVLTMGDHCSPHNIFQVDGDIDVTALAAAVARALSDGHVTYAS